MGGSEPAMARAWHAAPRLLGDTWRRRLAARCARSGTGRAPSACADRERWRCARSQWRERIRASVAASRASLATGRGRPAGWRISVLPARGARAHRMPAAADRALPPVAPRARIIANPTLAARAGYGGPHELVEVAVVADRARAARGGLAPSTRATRPSWRVRRCARAWRWWSRPEAMARSTM